MVRQKPGVQPTLPLTMQQIKIIKTNVTDKLHEHETTEHVEHKQPFALKFYLKKHINISVQKNHWLFLINILTNPNRYKHCTIHVSKLQKTQRFYVFSVRD